MSIVELRNELRYWIKERNSIPVNSDKFEAAQRKVTELSKQFHEVSKTFLFRSSPTGNYPK